MAHYQMLVPVQVFFTGDPDKGDGWESSVLTVEFDADSWADALAVLQSMFQSNLHTVTASLA